jgi:hypothetical protein
VVLLFGIAIVGALLVVTLGGSAADEVRQQNDMEVAQQSMQALSSRLSGLKTGGEETASFSLPDRMQGNTEVIRQTSIELVAETESGTTCTTGDVQISTLVYENRDNELVGYEAGGVWRSYPDGGSTMVSPPAISYRNGRVELSMANVEGQMNSQIQARLDRLETRRFNENLTQSLFVDETADELQSGSSTSGIKCAPEDLDSVTMTVSGSPFSTAWSNYANDQWDSRPQASIVSGPDPLTVEFDLGDTRRAEFAVNDSDLTPTHEEGEQLSFDPAIRNVGGEPGSSTVETRLYVEDGDGWSEQASSTETTSTLLVEENERLDFQFAGSNFDADADGEPDEGTDYKIEIDTGDEVSSTIINVTDDPADLDITVDSSTPSSVSQTDDEDFVVNVENTGAVPTTRDFQFHFDTDDDGSIADDVIEVKNATTIPAGSTRTLSFAIPTVTQAPNLDAKVRTAALDPDGDLPESPVTRISVGDNPYYAIDDLGLSGSNTPLKDTSITVEADVENTGGTPAQPGTASERVTFEIRHAGNRTLVEDASTSGTVLTDDQAGVVAPGNTETFDYTFSGIEHPGEYVYTLETANVSQTGGFSVVESTSPYFLVSEVELTPEPAIQGDTVNVSALITNTGATTGTQDVTASLNGTEMDVVLDETVDSGNSERVNLTFDTDSANIVANEVTVETADTSLSRTLNVYQNSSGIGIGGSGNATINTTRNITASLTVLGTALTGTYDWSGGPYYYDWESTHAVQRGPVTMHIYTSNESNPNERIYAWGPETDLNTPTMRVRQIRESPMLNKSVTVGPGTELSVFAASYSATSCAPNDVDIDFDRGVGAPDDGVRTYYNETIDAYEDANRLRCDFDTDGVRLNVSKSRNQGNLKILNRTDSKIPNFEEARPDQRSAADIISESSRVDINSTGHVQLEPDQRLLLYELSEPDAEYENADTAGDPDYNDAVVLFEVVEVQETTRTEPEFELLNTSGPAQVTRPNDAGFEVGIRNNGGLDGSTEVDVYVDGSLEKSVDTGSIPGTSNETVSVPVSSTGLSEGLHEVEFRLASNEDQRERRNLYVGTQVQPFFIPGFESIPDAVEPGTDFDVTAGVNNIGQEDGTQTVEVSVANSGSSVSLDSSATWPVTIPRDDERTNVFSFDAGPDHGEATIEIETENTTAFRTVEVTEPEFEIDAVYVGTERYDRGDTITGTSIDQLTAVVQNAEPISDTQDVELQIDANDDGTYEDLPDSEPVTLENSATTVDLDTGLGSATPDIYDYRIVTDDDEFEGTIRIKDDPSGYDMDETAESDLISVNVNKIQLG